MKMPLAPESMSARVGMVFPWILSRAGSLSVFDILFVAMIVGSFGGVARGMAPLRENPFRGHQAVV